MEKLIYVCSPLRGDIETNLASAKRYCQYVMRSDHIPFAPHLYFTTFLDDNIKEEREIGMKMGIDMLAKCDELWVFGTTMSKGMLAEINWWRANRPAHQIRHFFGDEVKGGL